MNVFQSSLTVIITLQMFNPDGVVPFVDTLVKKGFFVSRPTIIQQPQGQAQIQSASLAKKGTTSALDVDVPNRRVIFQITNELKAPNENIEEVLSVLSLAGFPTEAFVQRIDVQGNVTIGLQADKASSFVPSAVKENFVKRAQDILNRPVKAIGVRLASEVMDVADVSKSPFTILIEPMFTDASDTKFAVQVYYGSSNPSSTVAFMQRLYENLTALISAFKEEK
ncbi:MAG: hypothetical protein ACRECH_10430 [Nitrososphaerales archaeon]